ncbi:gasdermin Eb isoform X2 [Mastacembelus armatus]|uniref:gasdermin Eb isoform X2 n=1 Tax=Mastacembelus armatus TaxID=205130 RepID=UPI000E463F64|nr:gasdermin-E isoform X2 [Mastacembelus armatus]
MFATATRNFVQEVDPGGLLVPVSSLSDTIALLTVVVKRRRFWFWQKPKYLPTGFNLNDILTGETPVQPVVVETDFLKYSGTYGDNTGGAINASFAHSDMSLAGKDSSKLQSSFGSLKKEEVDVQKLLHDSKDRVLDMSHCLVQQTKGKQRRVFGIVRERIVTTQPCSVIEEEHQARHCGGGLSICGPKSPKVSLKENGSLSKDSNVTMEIPTHTTIAYALIELEIKHDGRYDLEQFNDHFQLLSSLPVTTRSSLLQQVTKVMQDPAAVSTLQDVLEQMCLESLALGDVTATELQKQNIQAILDIVEQCGEVKSAQAGRSTSVLIALHLISSAMTEMTDDCLAALGMCCSPTVLQTMELLVQCVSGRGELSLSRAGLTARTDVFENIKDLFASSNVSLERDGDTVRTEIDHHHGNQPLVLCIAVRGLASLA